MSRRVIATVAGGAAVLGASLGIAAGMIAVGLARRFGPRPARPGGATIKRQPLESDEQLGHRITEAIRAREQS